MPKRTRLTDAGCQRLKPVPGKPYKDHFDAVKSRLCLTVYATGKKSWHLQHYPKRLAGRVTTRKLGTFPQLGVAAARKAARDFELNPEAATKAAADTFGEITEQFTRRHIEAKGLRSANDIKRNLNYAVRYLRDRKFVEIGRADYSNILDKIEDERGPGQATAVYIVLHTLTRWAEGRFDEYRSPIVSSMRRDHRSPTERARDRTLNDDEIRALWLACDDMGAFGDFTDAALDGAAPKQSRHDALDRR